jgi:uncharacterized protein YkwD
VSHYQRRSSWSRFEVAGVKRSVRCVLLTLFAWQLLASVSNAADVLSVVNTVRTQECARNNKPALLQLNGKLNQVALRVAGGNSPHDAAASVGYQATQLASIHLTGYSNAGALKQLLRERYCSNLNDRNLQHIGVAQRGDEIWILLGAQLNVPRDAAAASIRVLELVNAARVQARSCGSKNFAATTPLLLNATLTSAARAHSQEMAKHSYLEHQGRDGSTPAQRVTRAGYAWSHAGENIAGGAGTPEEVVAGWLNSPGHCANIMAPAFTEMGVAYVLSKDDYGIYWTQVFAAPRR